MKILKKLAIALSVSLILGISTIMMVHIVQAGESEYNPVLPPTNAVYTKYTFDIDLPTCTGYGQYCLSKHYYDFKNHIGYPPRMLFSMETYGTCDFSASVWAKDEFGSYINLKGSSYQSCGLVLSRTFEALNMTLTLVNKPNMRCTAWVCDDEDYGVFRNIIKRESKQ